MNCIGEIFLINILVTNGIDETFAKKLFECARDVNTTIYSCKRVPNNKYALKFRKPLVDDSVMAIMAIILQKITALPSVHRIDISRKAIIINY